ASKADPVAAALRAARDRYSRMFPRSSRRPATEELFIAKIVGQRHPAGATGWNDPSENGRGENPDRREQQRPPGERQTNRPTEERAVDYASQHHRKTNSGRESDNRRQRSKHRGFRKQQLSDLGRARSDRAQDRQLASPFRNQNRERQKNPRDRNEERDGEENVGN